MIIHHTMTAQILSFALLLCAYSLVDAEVKITFPSSPFAVLSRGISTFFRCEVTGPDEFKQWTDNKGNKIPENQVGQKAYVEAEGNNRWKLKLQSVEESMGGYYKCESKNQGTSPAVAELVIQASLLQCSETQQITRGRKDSIECEPGGSPAPQIRWRKKNLNGNFVEITDGRFTKTSKGLVVNRVKPEDEGVYKIHISQKDEMIAAEEEITVTVIEAPVINRKATRDKLYSYIGYDKDVKMTCEASGKPLPEVKIYKRFNGNAQQQYGDNVPVEKPGLYTIFIKTKEITDDYKFGDYECIARNIHGQEDSLKISLDYAEKPVLDVSRNIVGELGAETEITCPLKSGQPLPTYRWYRNGKELKDGKKYKLRTGYKEDGALVILNTEMSDKGEYVCVGKQLRENVTGKPFLKEVVEGGPEAGARMEEGTIAGIVIAVILIVIICIDVFCCFFNSCGVTFCCYNTFCGKDESGSKYATKDEEQGKEVQEPVKTQPAKV